MLGLGASERKLRSGDFGNCASRVACFRMWTSKEGIKRTEKKPNKKLKSLKKRGEK